VGTGKGKKKMLIRKATGEEMLKLWGFKDTVAASHTARFYYRHIISGNAVFWTVDNGGELIGELYVFLNLDDKDFADGKTTAYLCAFRVKQEYRGRGLGSSLLHAALDDLKEKGFRTATIGVGSDKPMNIQLYRRFGFTAKVKDCHYDPCGMDEKNQPEYEEEAWWLLAKDL
jgi:ribosomal protein S18 acetylase RimI-like enzyme